MEFDAKGFGSRLKAAIVASHPVQADAIRKLQADGLASFNSARLAEYINGEKVPTLERFAQMVYVLDLDVSIIFPGWSKGIPRGTSGQVIRHPGDRRSQCPVARCYGRLDELKGTSGTTKCDRCGQTFPF